MKLYCKKSVSFFEEEGWCECDMKIIDGNLIKISSKAGELTCNENAFKTYFYTEKQMRLLKLKQINEKWK